MTKGISTVKAQSIHAASELNVFLLSFSSKAYDTVCWHYYKSDSWTGETCGSAADWTSWWERGNGPLRKDIPGQCCHDGANS